MGTNYYFITRSSKLAHEYFADGYDDYSTWGEEYELHDIPEFYYEIHLNKLSWGWKPLFQNHKAFKQFRDLENFYKAHAEDLEIRDEYGDVYTWDEYKQEILNHAAVKPQPMKWVYKKEPSMFGGGKYLTTERCEPEEADLYIPFDHIQYGKTQVQARERLKAWNVYVDWDRIEDYHRDDLYFIDWVEGEFS